MESQFEDLKLKTAQQMSDELDKEIASVSNPKHIEINISENVNANSQLGGSPAEEVDPLPDDEDIDTGYNFNDEN